MSNNATPFTATDDETLLVASVDRFIAEHYDFAGWRRITARPDGFSREHWRTMAELGWLALALPEANGGLGLGARARMRLMESFGKGLVLEPYFTTAVLGAELVLGSDSAFHRDDILPKIAAGELLLAFAHAEPGSRFDLADVKCRAQRTATGYVLTGSKIAVLDAPAADRLLVLARTGGGQRDRTGLSLFVIDRAAPGLVQRDYPTVDHRRCSDIEFDAVAVEPTALLGAEDNAWPIVERAVDHAIGALCAEAVGAMGILIDATIEYLKTRRQFGRPLAEFQALRHRVADMIVAHEQCRSLVMVAASTLADKGTAAASRSATVSAAKVQTGRAGRFIGENAIQLHGAIAVTDELHVGHYVKRLMAIDTMFGNADFHVHRFHEYCP